MANFYRSLLCLLLFLYLNLKTLLKMVENRNFRRTPFFVIGYFFLITGAEMPLGLKEDILEETKWDYEEGYWLEKDFELERKIIVRDFQEKIMVHKAGQQLHPAKIFGYEWRDPNDLAVGINQLQECKASGDLNDKKHVNLAGWGLTEIPKEVFDINQLKSLNLYHNKITEIPDEISNLKSLKYLSLDYNQIETLTDDALMKLGELDSLKFLDLSNNYILSLPESFAVSLGKLKSLRTIGLDWNNISTLPDNLQNLEHLKWLMIRKNKIKTIPSAYNEVIFKIVLKY